MQSSQPYSDECKFCASYLREHGIVSTNFDEIAALAKDLDADYRIVKIRNDDFFTDLAEQLRALWPSGEKDGKWPWKDSTKNIVKRLKFLWEDRNLGNYSLSQCLMAARRYLIQFDEGDMKYMQTLKYFIFKQRSIVQPDGRMHYTQESKFADYLEQLQPSEFDFDESVTDLFDGDFVV